MKTITFLLFTVFIIFFNDQKSSAQFEYISPTPGSIYHNPTTNIILKNGNFIDTSSLTPALFVVNGSTSGNHSVTVSLSDDQKTILVFPSTEFADSEMVSVTVLSGIKTTSGQSIGDTSFEFQTHPHYYFTRSQKNEPFNMDGEFQEPNDITSTPSENPLILGLPKFEITSTGNEYNSKIFYYNFKSGGGYDTTADVHYRTILNDHGDSVFAVFDNNRGIDFKINHNGYLTYYNQNSKDFEMMDSLYNVIDSFFAGNGYEADSHEFQVFPNGHSYLLCYDVQIVDMSKVVNNGIDTAHVTGLVLQELDKKKQVVFQWRSWDHFNIKDTYVLTHNQAIIDLVHGNSIELEQDGNILLSSRHLSEITKINHETGDIIWRFGGKNNQFTFINDVDTIHFYFQHDARQLPNGHITLFDNNSQKGIPSSAKEYAIDEVNKTATLTWSYQHPPLDSMKEIFSNAMGNVQRLPNGNTLICWGYEIRSALIQYPNFTEVDSLGNIVWEFGFTGDEGYISYRAFKFPWDRCVLPTPSSLSVGNITSNSVDLSWAVPSFASGYQIQYKKDTSENWSEATTSNNYYTLTGLSQLTLYDWRIKTVCSELGDSSDYSPIQYFTTTLATGISILPASTFNFYPNPATDQINLNFKIQRNGEVNFSIVNLLGEVVYSKRWMATEGSNRSTIKLPVLNSGVYLLRFKMQEGEFYTRLVIQ